MRSKLRPLACRKSLTRIGVLSVLPAPEREVLDCMIEGLSRVQIATRLRVSGNTVRTHTQNLIGKLGAHSSLEAVTLALRSHHYAASPP